MDGVLDRQVGIKNEPGEPEWSTRVYIYMDLGNAVGFVTDWKGADRTLWKTYLEFQVILHVLISGTVPICKYMECV